MKATRQKSSFIVRFTLKYIYRGPIRPEFLRKPLTQILPQKVGGYVLAHATKLPLCRQWVSVSPIVTNYFNSTALAFIGIYDPVREKPNPNCFRQRLYKSNTIMLENSST